MCKGSNIIATLTNRTVYCEQSVGNIERGEVTNAQLSDAGLTAQEFDKIPKIKSLLKNSSLVNQINSVYGDQSEVTIVREAQAILKARTKLKKPVKKIQRQRVSV